MNTIKEIIEVIEQKPAMYIGRNSIFSLRAYLAGFVLGNKTLEDKDILNDFQKWIEEKYKIKTSQSWGDILHFFSSDEQDALNLFFEEFKEFTNR